MKMSIDIGDYAEFKNAKGDVILRLVCIGDNTVLEHRRYRNIVTNEMSGWRPADNAKPITMTDAQRNEFVARKI
jgi:hypothetical protein